MFGKLIFGTRDFFQRKIAATRESPSAQHVERSDQADSLRIVPKITSLHYFIRKSQDNEI